jgi:hypothetical protein
LTSFYECALYFVKIGKSDSTKKLELVPEWKGAGALEASRQAKVLFSFESFAARLKPHPDIKRQGRCFKRAFRPVSPATLLNSSNGQRRIMIRLRAHSRTDLQL